MVLSSPTVGTSYSQSSYNPTVGPTSGASSSRQRQTRQTVLRSESESDLDFERTNNNIPPLPTARLTPHPPLLLSTTSTSSIRRWDLLLLAFQCLSFVPSLIGTLYCLKQCWWPSRWTTGGGGAAKGDGGKVGGAWYWRDPGDDGGLIELRSTRIDYAVAALWAAACGYYSHSLAAHLLRRWLIYYHLFPSLIRLVSLQAICWPLTRTTLTILGRDQLVAAWMICAISAAVSEVVGKWVASNIWVGTEEEEQIINGRKRYESVAGAGDGRSEDESSSAATPTALLSGAATSTSLSASNPSTLFSSQAGLTTTPIGEEPPPYSQPVSPISSPFSLSPISQSIRPTSLPQPSRQTISSSYPPSFNRRPQGTPFLSSSATTTPSRSQGRIYGRVGRRKSHRHSWTRRWAHRLGLPLPSRSPSSSSPSLVTAFNPSHWLSSRVTRLKDFRATRTSDRVLEWDEVVQNTIIPLMILSMITAGCGIYQLFEERRGYRDLKYGGSGVVDYVESYGDYTNGGEEERTSGGYGLNHSLSFQESQTIQGISPFSKYVLDSQSTSEEENSPQLNILLLITSSWLPRSRHARAQFRNSSLLLAKQQQQPAHFSFPSSVSDSDSDLDSISDSDFSSHSFSHSSSSSTSSSVDLSRFNIPTGVSLTHRFLIGQSPPSSFSASSSSHSPFVSISNMETEAKEYGDILMTPTQDGYEQLSRKIWSGFSWAVNVEVPTNPNTGIYEGDRGSRGGGEVQGGKKRFDYVVKTDDDMFLRLDIILRELKELGRRKRYWRGLGYWNIPPIDDPGNKNSVFDYDLGNFPPFTSGALYILSRDVAELATIPGPRRFVKNEDQSLGIWLYPYAIRPIHDPRIQPFQVCEESMIAKHFSHHFIEANGSFDAVQMYRNLIEGRKMCEGGLQKWCAPCWGNCKGRVNHWKDWGYECDEVKGLTLSSSFRGKSSSTKSLSLAERESLSTVVRIPSSHGGESGPIMGSEEDPWIIPDLLSHQTTVLSDTDDWHLLNMVCWTTSPSTFQERHWKAIETIWVHEPRAIILVFSPTLPEDFFEAYLPHGYRIHVVPISKDLLLKRGWFGGPESETWLKQWDRWAEGPNFFSHLTDYLRYIFLFRYGGVYQDMDAPWIRSSPNSHLEFIGADYSTLWSDLDWCLNEDLMYLAPGVMRFRKGWTMFSEILDLAFSPSYLPSCFNCVGPRAITSYVKSHRRLLEVHGLTILPRDVLYPKNWMEAHELLGESSTATEAMERLKGLINRTWSVHLYGKMTNHLLISRNSVAGVIFDRFSLRVNRPAGKLHSKTQELESIEHLGKSLELVFPSSYHYRSRHTLMRQGVRDVYLFGCLDGKFDGIDLIFLRGVKKSPVPNARVSISTSNGGKFALTSSSAKLLSSWPPSSMSISIPGTTNFSSQAVTTSTPPASSSTSTSITMASKGEVTLQEINALLSGLTYVPHPSITRDDIQIQIQFGNEFASGFISVIL